MPRDSGPCLLGPIAIHGAKPGHVLEIHIEAIVPGSYGWTFGGEIGFFNTALNRALGVDDGPPQLVRWSIDPTSMIGISHLCHRVRLRPFLGTLGLWEKVRQRPEVFLDLRTVEAEGVDVAAQDFLAGMTDRYAVRLYEELFIPKPWMEI